MQLREQLIQLRDKYGLSQQEFADRVGVSRQSVSRWESGKSVSSAKQAAALCAAFRLNAKAFLNGRIEEEGAEADASADLTAGSAEGAAGAASTTGAAVGAAPAAEAGENTAKAGETLQGLSRRKTRRLLLIALGFSIRHTSGKLEQTCYLTCMKNTVKESWPPMFAHFL